MVSIITVIESMNRKLYVKGKKMTETKYNILGQMEITLSYSIKEIVEALFAKYDDDIMNEMLNDPRFQDGQTTKHLKKLNSFQLKIYKGRLVVLGAYETYLQNREVLKNDRREL